MAIIDLRAGAEKFIYELIAKDNPEMLEVSDEFLFPLNKLEILLGGRVGVKLVGNPGDVNQVQFSGKSFITYRRQKIIDYFKNITVNLGASNPTSTRELVPPLRYQYGLALKPEHVIDEPLNGAESGTTTLRFSGLELVFEEEEFVVNWVKPIPLRLDVIWGDVSLSDEDVVPAKVNLDNFTPYWQLHKADIGYLDSLASFQVGTLFNTTVMVDTINKLSLSSPGVWNYDAVEDNDYNVGGGSVVYNGPNDQPIGTKTFDKVMKFQVANQDNKPFTGLLAMYYDIVHLDQETLYIEDSEIALRGEMSALTVDGAYTTALISEIGNKATKQRFGTWVCVNDGTKLRNFWNSAIAGNEVGDFNGYNRKLTISMQPENTITTTPIMVVYYNA